MSARSLSITAETSARRTLAERGGLVVVVCFYVFVTTVLAGLWRAGAAAKGGAVAGYSAVALTWYIATTEAATVSLNTRMIADIGIDITSGAIAVELLRPASVLTQRVVSELGRVLPRIIICALTGVVLAWITAGHPPSGIALAVAAPSLVLAVMCNIVAQHAFAALSFWLGHSGGAWFLYQKLIFMVGGMLIPLEVLPDWLRAAALVLPFRAMAYAPGRLASGHLEPILLVEQVGWLAVLACVATAVFGAGERRLQVVGG